MTVEPKEQPKILFIHNHSSRFVEIDRNLLSHRYQVVTRWESSIRRLNPLRSLRDVAKHDLTLCWFASWHSILPLAFARVLRKPSVLISGGYDTARLPEISYGHYRSRPLAWLSRICLRLAGTVITNSHYALQEVASRVHLPEERTTIVPHGVQDLVGYLPDSKERLAISVGNVDSSTVIRKGFDLFVEAARLIPDARFVLAGHWADDAIMDLRKNAPANMTFTGWLTDAELADLYARGAAHVLISHHEAFGMSVAEAMLAGCIPVVSPCGALPEVVGSTGEYVSSREPSSVAAAIRNALEAPQDRRRLARERVTQRFSLAAREDSLCDLIDGLLK